jgi:hypothetical protein
MRKLLVTLCLSAVATMTMARADFTSYTLTSQSDPLTYTPVTSYTFDSNGDTNFTVDNGTGAVATFAFTDTQSIVGDSIQLAWIYPDASTVFEYFPSIIVPGSVDLGFGADGFTIDGNTITITNDTSGWTGADFNGFTVTDLTRQAAGPSGSVPDTASTLLLFGAAIAGLAIGRRGLACAR